MMSGKDWHSGGLRSSVGDDLSQISAIAKGAAPRPGRVMPVAAVTWGCINRRFLF